MDLNTTVTLAMNARANTDDGSKTVCNQLDCLPILRWSNTIGGLTSRVDDVSLFNPRSWFEAVPANITGIFLSIGNNLWAAAATIERMADGSTAMLDSFGKMANRFTGAVWNSLSDWRILSMAIILVVGTSLWQYIHNGTIQAFGQRMVALVLGLAMFATVGIASANNPEKPATLTPYWMVTTTSKYIGDVAGSASDALVDEFDHGGTFLAHDFSKNATGDLLSCRNYLHELHALNQKAAAIDNKSRDTVLTAMNTMWEETALRIYARTQYGPGGNADQVFCRVPEYRAGVTAQNMAYITDQAVNNGSNNKANVAWGGGLGDAMAWHPDLWEADLDDKDSTKVANEDVFLDRWVTMWDVCGYGKQRNNLYARSGWAFVNSIEGSDRGVDKSGDPSSDKNGTDLVMQCRAAIEAKTTKTGSLNSKLQPSTMSESKTSCPKIGREGVYCREQKGTASNDFVSMKAITNKFNIRTDSNWRSLSQTNNNTTDENVINAAKRTLSYQQGKVTASELGASVVFSPRTWWASPWPPSSTCSSGASASD